MNPSTRNLKLETRNFICLFRNPQSAIRNLVLLGIIILFFPPGSPAQTEKTGFSRQSRIVMGTSVEITITQADPRRAEEAMEAAFREVERIDFLMSHYREDSEVSQITRQAGRKEVKVSPETLKVIERALHFSRLSGGAFDITIGPIFRLWDFRRGEIPHGEKLRENLKRVDYRRIKVDPSRSTVYLDDPGTEVDLGAIAKGFAADRACLVLKEKGIGNFLVNAGGDMRAGGRKEKEMPWTVGIQHPRLPSHFIARIQPRSAGIATSGDYEKYFLKDGQRYHHILVPSTGEPARGCQSVTILAPTAMDADVLATTVFVLGPKKGFALIEEMPDVHALIVDRRGSVLLSPKWPAGVLLPP